ncbi:MAG: SecDF P1 head subdomain-containing protein [Anaerolineae bacterium]
MGGLVIVALAALAVSWTSRRVPLVVEIEPTVLLFEANEPASWRELLHSGAVLQGRARVCYPHTRGLEGWNVQDGRLEVRVAPGVSPMWVVREAMRPGMIELVEGGTEFLPIGKRIKTGKIARPDLDIYETVLESHHFVMAEAYLRYNKPVIEFRLTPQGNARLAAHTEMQSGYYLCLSVDGKVVNCPILRTPLVERHGLMELSSNATLAHARAWAALLRSGPLPVTLRAMMVPSTVDPESLCIFE